MQSFSESNKYMTKLLHGIKYKYVFKIKRDRQDNVVRFKASPVPKGFFKNSGKTIIKYLHQSEDKPHLKLCCQ